MLPRAPCGARVSIYRGNRARLPLIAMLLGSLEKGNPYL
jgi:hypothetical protein